MTTLSTQGPCPLDEDWVVVAQHVETKAGCDGDSTETSFVCVPNTPFSRLRSEMKRAPTRTFCLFGVSTLAMVGIEWLGALLWILDLSLSQALALGTGPVIATSILIRSWGRLPALTFAASTAAAAAAAVPVYSAMLLLAFDDGVGDGGAVSTPAAGFVAIVIFVLEFFGVASSYFREELPVTTGVRTLQDFCTALTTLALYVLGVTVWIWSSLTLQQSTAIMLQGSVSNIRTQRSFTKDGVLFLHAISVLSREIRKRFMHEFGRLVWTEFRRNGGLKKLFARLSWDTTRRFLSLIAIRRQAFACLTPEAAIALILRMRCCIPPALLCYCFIHVCVHGRDTSMSSATVCICSTVGAMTGAYILKYYRVASPYGLCSFESLLPPGSGVTVQMRTACLCFLRWADVTLASVETGGKLIESLSPTLSWLRACKTEIEQRLRSTMSVRMWRRAGLLTRATMAPTLTTAAARQ